LLKGHFLTQPGVYAAMGDETAAGIRLPDEGALEPQGSEAWSRRSQIAFVAIAMPVLVFLLVGVPYLLSHYVVNSHSRFNYIPPPLGGDRALEGHWVDAPTVPVRRVNFGKDMSAFGWIAADGDLTTNVLPTASGTVSKVLAGMGQAVAKDAPLFAIRTHVAGATGADTQPSPQEIVVTAPAAGAVTQLNIAVGQAVKTATAGTAPPAVSIADLSSVWLVAEIDENDARSLRPGQVVDVRPTALSDRVLKGRLLTVSPTDPETGRAPVRIAIDNADGGLKPNMFAEFDLSSVDDVGTLAVPESAVLFENGSKRVFVAAAKESDADASGKLAARAIRTGRIRDGFVEVLDGLQPGENVEASDALFIDRAAKGY
jgi:multidrug efflux pump subunit AcrA (membrane-fusion protein)